jgi:hypothetical protein
MVDIKMCINTLTTPHSTTHRFQKLDNIEGGCIFYAVYAKAMRSGWFRKVLPVFAYFCL